MINGFCSYGYANCLFVPSSALQMEPGADDPLDGDEFDSIGYTKSNSALRIVLVARATILERFNAILLGAY